MPKYYWIPTLIALLLFGVYFGIQSWHYLNTPIVLDYIYNPTLKMYEPVEMPRLPASWDIIFVLPMMVSIWWHSPLYIFIPFNLLMAWCALLFIMYRPCIRLG